MTSIKNLQVEEVEMSTAINAASLVSNVTAKLNGLMVTLEAGIYSSEDFISDGSNTVKLYCYPGLAPNFVSEIVGEITEAFAEGE